MLNLFARIRYHLEGLFDPENIHRVFLLRAVHKASNAWTDGQFDVVLDYGCGNCPYQKQIARVSHRILSADIGVNPLANIIISPAGTLPLLDESIDLVVSFQVLEHVADYQLYLRESARVCKKNGYLLMSVPSVWPFHPHPTDYRRWMEQGLIYDLEKVGFKISEIIPVLNPLSSSIQYFLSICRYALWATMPRRLMARFLAITLNPIIILSEFFGKQLYRYGAGNYVVKAVRQ